MPDFDSNQRTSAGLETRLSEPCQWNGATNV
jgi:hypothetical protein